MPHESTQLHEGYYILATKTRADERTRVIKHGDSFGVFDHAGMIRPVGLGQLGIYHDGTRYLSLFEIGIERVRPMLLNSTVLRDNILHVDLANPDLLDRAEPLARDSVHLFVQSLLWDRTWHARLVLHNYAHHPVHLEMSLLFDADHADIFEVRGIERLRRGRRLPPTVERNEVVLAYEGLDRMVRATRLTFEPAPRVLDATRASFETAIAPEEHVVIDTCAEFELGQAGTATRTTFDLAHERSHDAIAARRQRCATVEVSNPLFAAWIERSAADVDMMITDTPYGPYPYAGVPWFSTPFGRDGIITAYERLWLDPMLARGVLAFLAATQATQHDHESDAEPGKVIHEMRGGEMAALGEVPFGRYYGSIDATPLFVVLAGAYYRRTADRAFVESLWPALERALAWVEEHGDLDDDGFVEYARRSSRGLTSQGWKDSVDSISHADGSLASGPVALCEVQGYVYAARRAGAELAHALGYTARSLELDRTADVLRERFERAFFDESLGTYVLALDASRRCSVSASNAGHCLWSGIASPDRARRVADVLMGERMFSGWGIRTLAAGEHRYNPLSYHNGSVWPHDNALIAMGLARYGFKHECARLLEAFYDASLYFDLRRMPELFCGFRPRPHEGPTLYPVACAPQAWAAGAVFLLLQACLGLDIDARARRVVLDRPILPRSIDRLVVRDLDVGPARIDLALVNHDGDVSVQLLGRAGEVGLVITK